jgi:hypothetical protein
VPTTLRETPEYVLFLFLIFTFLALQNYNTIYQVIGYDIRNEPQEWACTWGDNNFNTDIKVFIFLFYFYLVFVFNLKQNDK